MRRFTAATIAYCLIGASVFAGQSRRYMSYGPTGQSCGAFANKFPDGQATLQWWALGFVSGAGRELTGVDVQLAETDSDGIKAWIAKYCADHPLDSYSQAVVALVDELKARAAK